MSRADTPLTTADAWADDVWIRRRSGPTPKAIVKRDVEVSLWHRVRDVNGFGDRLRTTCGYGPRDGFIWPSGGSRLEVARPYGYGGLPGEVCPRCRTYPAVTDLESDVVIVDEEPDLDALADAVAERLLTRIDARKAAQ